MYTRAVYVLYIRRRSGGVQIVEAACNLVDANASNFMEYCMCWCAIYICVLGGVG